MIDSELPIVRNINAGNNVSNYTNLNIKCVHVYLFTYIKVLHSKDLQFFFPDKMVKFFYVHY